MYGMGWCQDIDPDRGEESADIAFNLPIPAGYETYAYRAIDVAAPSLYTVGGATISPTELTQKVVIIPWRDNSFKLNI